MDKKVLLIGGGGTIGTYVAKELLAMCGYYLSGGLCFRQRKTQIF